MLLPFPRPHSPHLGPLITLHLQAKYIPVFRHHLLKVLLQTSPLLRKTSTTTTTIIPSNHINAPLRTMPTFWSRVNRPAAFFFSSLMGRKKKETEEKEGKRVRSVQSPQREGKQPFFHTLLRAVPSLSHLYPKKKD